MLRFIVFIFCTCIACIGQGQPQKKITTAKTQVKTLPATNTNNQSKVKMTKQVNNVSLYGRKSADTIPLTRRKYYQVDTDKYKKYTALVVNDSIKTVRAVKKDWDDFSSAFKKLNSTLAKDPYGNVLNYIDREDDFSELTLLDPVMFPFTSKVCLRQLIFNLKLVDNLLSHPLKEKENVEVFAMVMRNIDTLNMKYIMTTGTSQLYSKVILPKVTFKVFDKNGAPVSNAKIYLVGQKTCRDITCKSCIPAPEPCDVQKINAIVNNPDKVFDCANETLLELDFGHYHLFIVSNNKILWYEMRHVDASTLKLLEKNVINIRMQ